MVVAELTAGFMAAGFIIHSAIIHYKIITMLIRLETPEDYHEVENIRREAL